MAKESLEKITYDKIEPIIDKVALYIIDMRLLRNIIADYQITLRTIKKTNGFVDECKLFGYIVYKNYYPDDFAKLHKKKGIFFNLTLIDNIKMFRDLVSKVIKGQIVEVASEISTIEFEKLNQLEELDLIYFMKILDRESISLISLQKINGRGIGSFLQIQKSLGDLSQIQSLPITFGGSQRCISCADIIIRHFQEYVVRRKVISEKITLKILQKKNYKLENQLLQIESYSLSKLLEINEPILIEKIHDFIEPNKNSKKELPGLLKILLLYGYLDERYMLYTTHRHPDDDLTDNDLAYLRAAMERKEYDAGAPLNNIAAVLAKMSDEELRSPGARNYLLVDYLLLNGDFNRLRVLFEKILCSQEEMQTIYAFWRHLSNSKKFISWLNNSWSNFISDIVKADNYPENHKYQMVKAFLKYYLTDNNIDSIVEQKDSLSSYLSNHIDLFIDWDETQCVQLFELLVSLGVEFTQLEPGLSNRYFIDACLEHDTYIISMQNILIICQHLNVLSDEIPDYSFLINLSCKKFTTRLIESIVDVVDFMINGHITISKENDIIFLLSHPDLVDEMIKAFIEYVEFKINVGGDRLIPNSHLPKLIEHDRLYNKWETAVYIIEHIDKDIGTAYLEQHANEISNEVSVKTNSERDKIYQLIPIALLNEEAFMLYMSALGCLISDLEDINDRQIGMSIDNGFLDVSVQMLKHINKRDQTQAICYLEKYGSNLVASKEFEDEAFLNQELLSRVLTSTKLTDSQKRTIFESQVSIQEDNFWDKNILIFLLTTTDVPDLVKINKVDFCLGLIKGDDEKVKLILSQSNYFNGAKLKEFILQVDSDFSDLDSTKKTFQVVATYNKEAICMQLKRLGFIKNYSYSNNASTKIRIIKC